MADGEGFEVNKKKWFVLAAVVVLAAAYPVFVKDGDLNFIKKIKCKNAATAYIEKHYESDKDAVVEVSYDQKSGYYLASYNAAASPEKLIYNADLNMIYDSRYEKAASAAMKKYCNALETEVTDFLTKKAVNFDKVSISGDMNSRDKDFVVFKNGKVKAARLECQVALNQTDGEEKSDKYQFAAYARDVSKLIIKEFKDKKFTEIKIVYVPIKGDKKTVIWTDGMENMTVAEIAGGII